MVCNLKKIQITWFSLKDDTHPEINLPFFLSFFLSAYFFVFVFCFCFCFNFLIDRKETQSIVSKTTPTTTKALLCLGVTHQHLGGTFGS